MRRTIVIASFYVAMVCTASYAFTQVRPTPAIRPTLQPTPPPRVTRENFSQRRMEDSQKVSAMQAEAKRQLSATHDAIKGYVDAQHEELKQKLATIRDERKRTIVERVYTQINELNKRLTDHFLSALNQIEDVLGRVKSRTDKAEANDLDVSAVRAAIDDAEKAIASSRAAIIAQAGRIYTVSVSNESTLKIDVRIARDAFRNDIEKVRATVVAARDAVRNAAVALAKIPRADEVEVTPTPAASPAPSP